MIFYIFLEYFSGLVLNTRTSQSVVCCCVVFVVWIVSVHGSLMLSLTLVLYNQLFVVVWCLDLVCRRVVDAFFNTRTLQSVVCCCLVFGSCLSTGR